MGYLGETKILRFDKGSFTTAPNRDSLPPEMLIGESKNITLHDGGRRKRGGTFPVGTAISGTPQMMGLFSFELLSGTLFQMIAAGGKVYKDYTNTIKTGLNTTNYFSFAKYNNKLYFTDGASALQEWDGAAGSSSNIATPAPDWASNSKYPQQIINHGNKLSERLWIWTIENIIFGSQNTNGSDFGVSNGVNYTLYRNNITAIWEYDDLIFIFTKRKTFTLDDSDADTSKWGFKATPYFAGAAHWRVIAETENDLYVMMDDGEIYSMRSVQFTGDYKKSSIVKPAFIDKYIRDNIDLTQISKFHMEYDPIDRTLKPWMVRNGQTVADVCIPYYIDDQKWGSPLLNTTYNSGFKASVSAIITVAPGDERLRTGDHVGQVWDLNRSTKSDNGNGYRAQMQQPDYDGEYPRAFKHWRRLIIIGIPTTTNEITLVWSIDGISQNTITAKLIEEGVLVGSDGAIVGTFVVGGSTTAKAIFELGVNGEKLSWKLFDETAGNDFFILSALFDIKKLGVRPQ